MLISLIVPFYNEECHLVRCIRSIQQQTFADYEVLLVDNCSTDGSYAIAEQLTQGDERYRLLRTDQKGLFLARNQALAAARGEYICFLDSDDELLPNYLSDLYADSLLSEVDMVVQGFTRVKGDSQEVLSVSQSGIFDLTKESQQAFSFYNVTYMGNVFGKLYRRSLIQEYGLTFSPQVYLSEDLYFVVSYLAVCQRVILSKKSNYLYIFHRKSMSTYYWDFETEQLSYLALEKAWQSLLKTYCCPSLESAYGSFTGNYINRLIFTATNHPQDRRHSEQYLKIIEEKYLSTYQQYYSPTSLFTHGLKWSAVHHFYSLYYALMQAAILRYRIAVNYC